MVNHPINSLGATLLIVLVLPHVTGCGGPSLREKTDAVLAFVARESRDSPLPAFLYDGARAVIDLKTGRTVGDQEVVAECYERGCAVWRYDDPSASLRHGYVADHNRFAMKLGASLYEITGFVREGGVWRVKLRRNLIS